MPSIFENPPTLQSIWEEQHQYNELVRSNKPMGWLEWMKDYMLGTVSELDEVLGALSWKAHRRGKEFDRVNLARELADLTKYVLSLWDWAGFTPTDMLQYIHEKNMELERQWQQDFDAPPLCHNVIITDIDGTIADYRKGFKYWLQRKHPEELQDLPEDRATSLAMEIDLGISYPQYARLKDEFEASGGYASLPLYPDVPEVFRVLAALQTSFIAYTARPHQTFSRIWNDTWTWLREAEIDGYIGELRIGKEQRIARACELQHQGYNVIMLEDEPDTAIRAAVAGIRVFLRSQPYNVGVEHPHITRFSILGIPHLVGHLEVSNENQR